VPPLARASRLLEHPLAEPRCASVAPGVYESSQGPVPLRFVGPARMQGVPPSRNRSPTPDRAARCSPPYPVTGDTLHRLPAVARCVAHPRARQLHLSHRSGAPFRCTGLLSPVDHPCARAGFAASSGATTSDGAGRGALACTTPGDEHGPPPTGRRESRPEAAQHGQERPDEAGCDTTGSHGATSAGRRRNSRRTAASAWRLSPCAPCGPGDPRLQRLSDQEGQSAYVVLAYAWPQTADYRSPLRLKDRPALHERQQLHKADKATWFLDSACRSDMETQARYGTSPDVQA
jgi:hypothetical protein